MTVSVFILDGQGSACICVDFTCLQNAGFLYLMCWWEVLKKLPCLIVKSHSMLCSFLLPWITCMFLSAKGRQGRKQGVWADVVSHYALIDFFWHSCHLHLKVLLLTPKGPTNKITTCGSMLLGVLHKKSVPLCFLSRTPHEHSSHVLAF